MLEAGKAIGIWLRMKLTDADEYRASETFQLIFTADQAYHKFYLAYSRFQLEPDNVRWKWIPNKTHFVRVTVDNVVDEDYYLGSGGVWYCAYLNSRLVGSYQSREFDVFIGDMDQPFNLQIFAVPHENFKRNLALIAGGPSVNITFSSERPDYYDVNKMMLYTDNATGVIDRSTVVGQIDAKTAAGAGSKLAFAEIVEEEDDDPFV